MLESAPVLGNEADAPKRNIRTSTPSLSMTLPAYLLCAARNCVPALQEGRLGRCREAAKERRDKRHTSTCLQAAAL